MDQCRELFPSLRYIFSLSMGLLCNVIDFYLKWWGWPIVILLYACKLAFLVSSSCVTILEFSLKIGTRKAYLHVHKRMVIMPAIYERGDYEIILESNFLQTLKQFAVVVSQNSIKLMVSVSWPKENHLTLSCTIWLKSLWFKNNLNRQVCGIFLKYSSITTSDQTKASPPLPWYQGCSQVPHYQIHVKLTECFATALLFQPN